MTALQPIGLVAVLDGYAQPMPLAFHLPEATVASGPDACEACFWAVRLADGEVLDDWVWSIELNAGGALEFTMFAGPPYDLMHDKLMFALYRWDKGVGGRGLLTGPKRTGYRLANGAVRRPNVSWTAEENLVTPQSQFNKARPHCPDFVAEMRSDIHRLPILLAKMQEYMDNGARLGWLIDPIERTVRIYRAGVAEPELLQDPETLDGADVLPGFTIAVRQLIFDLV